MSGERVLKLCVENAKWFLHDVGYRVSQGPSRSITSELLVTDPQALNRT